MSKYKDLVIHNVEEASEYMRRFLPKFYQNFDVLIEKKTYFFGEGFAGKYIPSFVKLVNEEKIIPGL